MKIKMIKTGNVYKVKYKLFDRIKMFFGFNPRFTYKNDTINFNRPLEHGKEYYITFPKL